MIRLWTLWRRRSSGRGLLGLALLAVALSGAAALPALSAPIALGVMGDSLSDEYQFNGRGYASNWVEQLATAGTVNFGASGSYAAPRYQGFAYNWALSGATSATVLSGGQATGLAGQIPSAGIGYAMLVIGANDFAPGSTAYDSIYNGTWNTAQINSYVSGVVANISTALSDVLPTGVKMGVATLPDYGIAPAVQAAYTNPAQRQLVANAIDQVNQGIKALAQSDHIVVADMASMINAVFGPESAFHTTVLIGNVTINLNQTTSSNPSTAGFVSDGIHPNTTMQGVLANLFMQALDTGYNAGVPLFTEAQILAHDGLSYGGSDTLAAQIGSFNNFVINDVPEPSTVVLALAPCAGLALGRIRRRIAR